VPTSDPNAEREIVSTRVFAAPREAVFGAFADPVRLAQWWGPAGFTNTIHEFDLRPGGRWRFTMHGPDGADYPNEKEFVEVVPAARIAFRHRQAGHDFQMTMEFSAHDAGTELTWRMQFESAAEFARIKGFIAIANEQNLDRLAAHLAAPVRKNQNHEHE
jgi:uncharacterized protein YndB with AHSA1/START domain